MEIGTKKLNALEMLGAMAAPEGGVARLWPDKVTYLHKPYSCPSRHYNHSIQTPHPSITLSKTRNYYAACIALTVLYHIVQEKVIKPPNYIPLFVVLMF